MSDKDAANAHLRVRLAAKDKDFLVELSTREGASPNISRAVKQLIEKGRKDQRCLEVLPESMEILNELARLLRREPCQVLDETLKSISNLIESDQLPLIVMELRLVKKYLSGDLPAPVLDTTG